MAKSQTMKVDELKRRLEPLFIRHGIKRAGVFGSLAKGEAQPESDIDILVELASQASLLDFVGIKYELEELLGKKVDLVEYRALKNKLKEQILSEEIRIYG